MEFFTFDWVTDPGVWLSLVTLIALEVVLGIDNLVFITILTDRCPERKRPLARRVGLALALVSRLILLATLFWIVTLTNPLFHVLDLAISWRDLILMAGGIFLMIKATHEIHDEVEGAPADRQPRLWGTSFGAVVAQIAVVDVIFSLDSVMTAVGMVDELWIMVVAVVFAIVIMMMAANPLAAFVSKYPTVKMLALSFLLMIGMFLVADGLHFHIPKGYLYFSLAFSILVEALNHGARRRRKRSGTRA